MRKADLQLFLRLIKTAGKEDAPVACLLLIGEEYAGFPGCLLKTEQDDKILFSEQVHILEQFRTSRREYDDTHAEAGEPELQKIRHRQGSALCVEINSARLQDRGDGAGHKILIEKREGLFNADLLIAKKSFRCSGILTPHCGEKFSGRRIFFVPVQADRIFQFLEISVTAMSCKT